MIKPRTAAVTLPAILAILALAACEEPRPQPLEPDMEPLFLQGPPASTPGAIVVRQTCTDPLGIGWCFVQESGTKGSGSLVTGPDDPPLGSGSARFELASLADGLALITRNPRFRGVPLNKIDEISYHTFVEDAPGAQAVALQFDVVDDVEDPTFSRLVFEPLNNTAAQGPVTKGVWQQWDGIDGGAARWWATRDPLRASCPISAPCTWDEILDKFPRAAIHPDFGSVILKAGSGWASFDGNADAVGIVIDGAPIVFDFEPPRSGRRP